MPWICQLNHASAAHSDKVVLDDVTLSLLQGAKVGVVGPNGAGKSTLLRIMAGWERPAHGGVALASQTTVGLLPQEPRLHESSTVLANVEDGVSETRGLLDRFSELTTQLVNDADEALLSEIGTLQHELDRREAWELDSQIKQAMHALQCPPPEAYANTLSGGERRRVALCALLLRAPDLLLLDEPTNHLDTESVQWLEQYLSGYRGTVVAVTHDRYFLDNVAGWILELDRGQAYLYQGNYTTYLEYKQARLTVEGRKDEKQRRRLQRELEWSRSSSEARQSKSGARLRRYEQMAAAAEKVRRYDFTEIQIPPGPRLGDLVIEACGVTKSLGGRELIRNLSFSLPRNGLVGVLGPNGVGKTTLLQMLVGQQHPDAGTVRVGDTVVISYVDQERDSITPHRTPWQLISNEYDFLRIGGVDIRSRTYLALFGFKGADQQKPARLFSGGERNRLNLALTLKQGGNLLLLDEPTNDLDVETLESLENALLDFPGCAVITAHDRWFLDRVATHILAWEGSRAAPGRWFWFEGNYAAYVQNKAERLGIEITHSENTAHRWLARG